MAVISTDAPLLLAIPTAIGHAADQRPIRHADIKV
jgi:hypothetical protein